MPEAEHQRGRGDAGPAARPRLWIVSELYYPEQTSTGYFLTRIAEGLADDFDVRVVCGQPTYSERGLTAPTYEERAGTRIHRLRATHFNKDRLLLRAVNAATLTVSAFWFALRKFRPGDQVLAVTNPPTVPIAVGLAARLQGCDAILLVHDVYPELLAAIGMLRPTSPLYRLLRRLFAGAYRLFGRIVVLGRDMAELVAAKIGGGEARIAIIPNWGDVDEIGPIAPAQNPFRREHGLDGRFVVQFSGNIGRTHDVELVLEAARLLEDDARIVFLFVGYGGKTGRVVEAARRPGSNVRMLPRQPRDLLCAMLAASDATIIPFVDGMRGLSVPSRMYNVMAAGVPIVAVPGGESELAMTVEECDAGWVLPEADAAALADLIRRLASEEGAAERRRKGEAGRAAVLARYTLPLILDLYRALLGASPPPPR